MVLLGRDLLSKLIQEVPRNIFISPPGILLLWKNASDIIETFVCVVISDFTDVTSLIDYFNQYLLMPLDHEEHHKSSVIWTYGLEPTHVFVKPLVMMAMLKSLYVHHKCFMRYLLRVLR